MKSATYGERVRFVRICLALVLLAIALTAGAARGEDYPTLGLCTGNGVRLRSEPSTKDVSNITGRVNDFDQLILLGETSVDGETWYRVEHPTRRGAAWIFGKYVEPYRGDAAGTPAHDMAIQVRMAFGLTPEKARALLGKPKKETKRKFHFDPANADYLEVILEYPAFRLRYLQGRLRHVEVSGGKASFGEIRVGDRMEKVREALGVPSSEGNEGWSYEVTPIEELLFEERDGRVFRMTWDEFMDA